MRNKYTHLHDKQYALCAKLASDWKMLTPVQKQPYVQMAAEERLQHYIDHPNYKYKPNKKKATSGRVKLSRTSNKWSNKSSPTKPTAAPINNHQPPMLTKLITVSTEKPTAVFKTPSKFTVVKTHRQSPVLLPKMSLSPSIHTDSNILGDVYSVCRASTPSPITPVINISSPDRYITSTCGLIETTLTPEKHMPASCGINKDSAGNVYVKDFDNCTRSNYLKQAFTEDDDVMYNAQRSHLEFSFCKRQLFF